MKNPPAFPGTYFVDRDGNLADPFSDVSARGLYNSGMSLLDYYAGLAMQGMSFSTGHGSGSQEFFQEQIRTAYKVARAMLEEREKPENNIN